MNVNCPRDPLTCRCEYHSGRVDEPPHLTGCGYPDRGCSCAVLRMIANPSVPIVEKPGPFHLPAAWQPSEGQMLEGAGLYVTTPTGRDDERMRLRFTKPRPPLQPGVLLDDPDPLGVYVAPVVLRLVARWAGAIAMVVGAVSIMYAEGQRQPAPGVGFGIALGLLMGAALLLGGRQQ